MVVGSVPGWSLASFFSRPGRVPRLWRVPAASRGVLAASRRVPELASPASRRRPRDRALPRGPSYAGYAHAILCWCFILAYSDSNTAPVPGPHRRAGTGGGVLRAPARQSGPGTGAGDGGHGGSGTGTVNALPARGPARARHAARGPGHGPGTGRGGPTRARHGAPGTARARAGDVAGDRAPVWETNILNEFSHVRWTSVGCPLDVRCDPRVRGGRRTSMRTSRRATAHNN